MSDSDEHPVDRSRRAFLGVAAGGAVAATVGVSPVAGASQPIAAIPSAVAQIGSPAANLAAFRVFWEERMGSPMPNSTTKSILNAEYERLSDAIAKTTGYSWESIHTFLKSLKGMERYLSHPRHSTSERWDSNDYEFGYHLLVVKSLAHNREFVDACHYALSTLRDAQAELDDDAGEQLIKSEIKPTTPLNDVGALGALIARAEKHIDDHTCDIATAINNNRMNSYDIWRNIYGDYTKIYGDFNKPGNRDLLMQQVLSWLLDSHYQNIKPFHIECGTGAVGSLKVEPLRYGEQKPSSDQREPLEKLSDRAYNNMVRAQSRLYLLQNPIDFDDPNVSYNLHNPYSIKDSMPKGSENLSIDEIKQAMIATDPAIFKDSNISPKKRKAMAASLDWAISIGTQAKSLADLLARLAIPEPAIAMTPAMKSAGSNISPGRQLLLEHVKSFNAQGVLIDNATGQIIIEDAALVDLVDARRVELEEAGRGERIMAHGARRDAVERH